MRRVEDSWGIFVEKWTMMSSTTLTRTRGNNNSDAVMLVFGLILPVATHWSRSFHWSGSVGKLGLGDCGGNQCFVPHCVTLSRFTVRTPFRSPFRTPFLPSSYEYVYDSSFPFLQSCHHVYVSSLEFRLESFELCLESPYTS
jgi:hypothetical protein